VNTNSRSLEVANRSPLVGTGSGNARASSARFDRRRSSVRSLVTAALSACFKSPWMGIHIRKHANKVSLAYKWRTNATYGLLKAACHDLRSCALERQGDPLTLRVGRYVIPRAMRWHLTCITPGRRIRILLQLSMIARALPPFPGLARSTSAVEDLKRDFQEPFLDTLPEEFETTFRRLYSKLEYKPVSLPRSWIPFSPGACLEHTRREGGFTKSMSLSTRRTRFGTSFRPPEVIEKVSRVHVIHEQGGKMRPVTCSNAGLVFHGHEFREKFFPLLYKFRSTSVPLRERPLSFFIPDDGEVRYLYSGDLSNATNLLSHECIRCIASVLGLDPSLVLSHKCNFSVEKYNINIDIDPVRGTFMGLPPSWIVLSLAHVAVGYIVDPTGRTFFLKGDDIVALWTPRQWELYNSLMVRVGFKVNPKKSFISSDFALFCEKAYRADLVRVVPGKGRKVSLRPLSVVSLRFLTKNTVDDTGVPSWVSSLNRYSEVCHLVTKKARGVFRRILLRRVPHWYFYLARDKKLPICFGGLGLRPCKEELLPKHSMGMYSSILNGSQLPLSVVNFRNTSEVLNKVKESLSMIEKLRLAHYKTARAVLDPSVIESIRSSVFQRHMVAGLSVTPEKKTMSSIKREVSRLWLNTKPRSNERVTYRDAYLLTRRLGVLSPFRDDPENGEYISPWASQLLGPYALTIKHAPRMVEPKTESVFVSLGTLRNPPGV